MAKSRAVSLVVKCIHGHDFILTPEVKLKQKGEGSVVQGFFAICPTCGGVAPVKTVAVGKMFGLGETATLAQVLKIMGLDANVPDSEPVASEDDDSGGDTENEDSDFDEDEDEDETVQGTDDEPPVVQPERKVARVRPMTRMPILPPENDQEYTVPSGQDVFLDIVRTAGLPPETVDFLSQWISVEPKWEDPRRVRDLLGKAGVANTKADMLAKKFDSMMELHQKKATRSEEVASMVAGNLGGVSRPGNGDRYGSNYRSGGGNTSGSVSDDLETITINAILEKNGNRLTPDVMAKIDEARAMFRTQRGESVPQMPGMMPGPMAMTPVAIQQMIAESNRVVLESVKQALADKAQKEKEEEALKLRQAADDKRYNDMMQMMQMVIASKSAAPAQAPQDSTEKLMLNQMMDMFKDQLSAKNQAPAQPGVMEHPLFLKLFDKVLEDSSGKPNEAMQGLAQELASVKEQLGHLGGGPGGLPSNPEQLHAYVDYMKTMNEISKTKSEFEDKAETRKLIATVAQTALQSVGEAIAATYIQNPGTPMAEEVAVRETPVDDGSVIQFPCPSCKAVISAPRDAKAIMCPNCKAVMDRAGQQMNQEQLEELQRKVLEEQETRREPDLPQVVPLPPDAPKAIKPLPLKKKEEDPKALGPVSLQMQEQNLAKSPEVPEKEEETGESVLTPPDQSPDNDSVSGG